MSESSGGQRGRRVGQSEKWEEGNRRGQQNTWAAILSCSSAEKKGMQCTNVKPFVTYNLLMPLWNMQGIFLFLAGQSKPLRS